jgi:Holliday junction resolvase
MTTNYSRGAAFERKVRAELESDGYGVQKAGGSKGAADLWAAKVGQLLMISVKKTNGQIPPKERAALFELAHRCGALPIVAYQPIPRKPIVYRLLTGTGSSQWEPFYLDEVVNA